MERGLLKIMRFVAAWLVDYCRADPVNIHLDESLSLSQLARTSRQNRS